MEPNARSNSRRYDSLRERFLAHREYLVDAARGYSLCRRIFAADLPSVDTFRSALFVLQASDARPSTLQVVAHCDVQRAAALAGQLHLVAVHERIKSSMIGAGGENVAGLQRVDGSDPFDTARNLV